MRLHNTLTRQHDEVRPLDGETVRIYSCGPTVYDHAHIGNLSAYIFADTLRRAIASSGVPVWHVMNYTDVDDKTIRRSQAEYDDPEPRDRLRRLTDKYIAQFNEDMARIGNDIAALTFVRATDDDIIAGMKQLVSDLHAAGFAYVADDGVYFSIEAYRKAGKKYGQLLELTTQNTSDARIRNDEYDKESVHDFALWKKRKESEPAWQFKLDGHDLTGRPGWHIECSVMSRQKLGQPFDIHTGGIDLIFPHHENEIAQSTALESEPVMASIFAHNDHILVDGKKMAKSAQNFYTLQDIIDRGFDPLAFRVLVLQSHYRSQVNFTWNSLEAARNRLQSLRAMADLRWQDIPKRPDAAQKDAFAKLTGETVPQALSEHMQADLNTPQALAALSTYEDAIVDGYCSDVRAELERLLQFLDGLFGLGLMSSSDISDDQKRLIADRDQARTAKDWSRSDELRDELKEQGIGLRDTAHGAVWYRL